MDPVPDPLLLRKSGSAGNRTRELCICSQKLWPLDHRGSQRIYMLSKIKYRKQASVIASQSSLSRYMPIAYIHVCIKFLSRFQNLSHVCNFEGFNAVSHIVISSWNCRYIRACYVKRRYINVCSLLYFVKIWVTLQYVILGREEVYGESWKLQATWKTQIDVKALLEGNRKQCDRDLTGTDLAKNNGGLLWMQ